MSVYDRLLRPGDKNCVVTTITVTASGTVITSDEPNVFHWRMYLGLSMFPVVSRSKGVLLDMIPTNPPIGTLVVSSKDTASSRAHNKVELSIATVGSPTVAQIVQLFIEKGMHRYNFDDTGSGCLYWTATGIQHLQDARLVESGAVSKLWTFHMDQAARHPGRHPLPVRQGTFYWRVSFFHHWNCVYSCF
ncbi:hypothetical protein OH76DRAFT_1359727 [Lentinus brumalis]|uniref:DUF7770 domain-containing protein n=1 Tax=Lentinus brumalis TaxID=2498619 RepID=A0A371CVN3_9APHY|nr:hypothetical protein OH76DRAFT_1359727 [Polyporus brumalis]